MPYTLHPWLEVIGEENSDWVNYTVKNIKKLICIMKGKMKEETALLNILFSVVVVYIKKHITDMSFRYYEIVFTAAEWYSSYTVWKGYPVQYQIR